MHELQLLKAGSEKEFYKIKKMAEYERKKTERNVKVGTEYHINYKEAK